MCLPFFDSSALGEYADVEGGRRNVGISLPFGMEIFDGIRMTNTVELGNKNKNVLLNGHSQFIIENKR